MRIRGPRTVRAMFISVRLSRARGRLLSFEDM
jgi:hypothetical protein